MLIVFLIFDFKQNAVAAAAAAPYPGQYAGYEAYPYSSAAAAAAAGKLPIDLITTENEPFLSKHYLSK